MATWFSKPIEWRTDMVISPDTDNSLRVASTSGPINLRAFCEGFLVYRSAGPTPPDTGKLEIVLLPDKWSDEMQKFFNPNHPDVASNSGISELPPGRVVYHDITRSAIEEKLHKLILESFIAWKGDHSQLHRSLDFIWKTDKSVHLKDHLLETWNKGKDPDESKSLVEKEITAVLDDVFKKSGDDPIANGLPIQAGDLIATSGGVQDRLIELVFEIRNLYGEPINPHFYLKRLERTSADDLAPAPPFKTDEPAPRIKNDPGSFLPIRIPKDGSVDFSLLAPRPNGYHSRLIWTHDFKPNGSHTTVVAARPGQSPTPPATDPLAQERVNLIWDNDNVTINKYAELFACPCELIVATIYKEARPTSAKTGDLHSIRFEEIKNAVDYAIDYENLMNQSRKAGTKLTADTAKFYWSLVGRWATHPAGPLGDLQDKPVKAKDLPTLEPNFPVDPTAKIGSGYFQQKISWQQLEEIGSVKASLIKRRPMALPALGKPDTKTHYQMIVEDAKLGAEVARIYFEKVGGIGLKDGKEEPKPATGFSLDDYPLPLAKNKDLKVILDPADATKGITWEQLLGLLTLLRANGVSDAPKPAYLPQPLDVANNFNFHANYTIPRLIALLPSIDEAKATEILQRYQTLQKNDLKFQADLGPPVPGVKGVRKDVTTPVSTEYLTLDETIAMSRIYPARISIGLGQVLLDTGSRKVIAFVKKHYASLFTDLAGSVPPDTLDGRVVWLWEKLWENRALQIAFIAAYHKQNATVYWQSMQDSKKKKTHKVGELMTKFDFPRVGACYNAGRVKKAPAHSADENWGLQTFEAYLVPYWSAYAAAVTRFDELRTDANKWARVRLQPDLEINTGMDPR